MNGEKKIARDAFTAGFALGRENRQLPGQYGTRLERAFDHWWCAEELRAERYELQKRIREINTKLAPEMGC